jgi:chromosome segregation ATPase
LFGYTSAIAGCRHERNAIQELSFKSMIDHGGLDINHGRKTIMGPDRHHQRKQEQLEESLEAARARVNKKEEALKSQQAKVAESEAKGHGRRLEQRRDKLVTLEQELKDTKGKQAKLSEQSAPPWARPASGQIATSASRRS